MSRTLEGTLGTLSRHQFDALRRFADEAREVPLTDLLREAVEHVGAARRAHQSDPLINVPWRKPSPTSSTA